MGRQPLKEAKEALEDALQGLEGVRMTPADDPKLAALKDDIRRTVKRPSGKAKRRSKRTSNA